MIIDITIKQEKNEPIILSTCYNSDILLWQGKDCILIKKENINKIIKAIKKTQKYYGNIKRLDT